MSTYIEEAFGVLTDDGLYLDCILVKPDGLGDDRVTGIEVWVPKYPLNKSSLLTCARQESLAFGSRGTTAHLVFDLRGTGYSDASPGNRNFQLDLRALEAWALERFGEIELAFLGRPDGHGRVNLLPIRPGVVLEHYHYPAMIPDALGVSESDRVAVIYLATFGEFGEADDRLCRDLAQAGYDVYGLDPLRYLLHASAGERLKPQDLWDDLLTFCKIMPADILVVGQPLASGLALLWATGVEDVGGVIGMGQAQAAFNLSHIFDNSSVHHFFLSRHLYRISPRPVALVLIENHPLGGNAEELAVFYESCGHPRRVERTSEVTAEFLLKLLAWLKTNS